MKHYFFVFAFAAFPTAATADVWSFETPSENIQCTVGQDFDVLSDITCTIVDRSGSPAKPRPDNCRAGWGHVFSMREKGPVSMSCERHSRNRDATQTADYGVTGEFGGFNCLSSKKGLKCINRDGNGFLLSRSNQEVIGAFDNPDRSKGSVVPDDQPQDRISPSGMWQSEFGQGIIDAAVTNPDGVQLRLVCNVSGLDIIPSRLTLHGYNTPDRLVSEGSTVSFVFDGSYTLPVTFNADDEFFVENTPESKDVFRSLVSRLMKHSRVELILSAGRHVSFSLRGSSKAIWRCPATPSSQPQQTKTPTSLHSAGPENKSNVPLKAEFSGYPVTSVLQGAAVFPDFSGRDRSFSDFQTRIKEGVSRGVNFAGHYSFVVIGCGTDCRFGFVTDLRNGEVFDFPYGGEEQYQMDLRFNPGSRLVKARWKGNWQSETCTEVHLLVEATRWHVLGERKIPTNDGLCLYGMPGTDVQDNGVVVDDVSSPIQSAESAQVLATTEANAPDIQDQLTQWLNVERKLKALGYNTGLVDGDVDAATISAVHAFQTDYGLEILSNLTPRQVAILDALALAKGADVASTENPNEKDLQAALSLEQQISNHLSDAYMLRDKILADPGDLAELFSSSSATSSANPTGYSIELIQTISGTIPFVGCSSDPIIVYGYYNVGQNIWLIMWIDQVSGELVDGRFVSGFRPKDQNKEVAWFNLYAPPATVITAMQSALKIQTQSFLELFPFSGCLASREMTRIMSTDTVQLALSEFRSATQQLGTPGISSMKSRLLPDAQGIDSASELALTALVPDVLGFSFLSAFVSVSNPAKVLVQGWEGSGENVKLISSVSGSLLVEE